MGAASPAAASSRKRLFSAMPSSMCCPFGPCTHWLTDMTPDALAWSAASSTANCPRWFRKPERFVEVVTSGAIVTMRSASAESPLASSYLVRCNM